ncbi:MAG: Rieske 2Fe-2S domain-containing protein [Pseudomonadales bacterium]|nr:Rieske 2Fe-2S domain-containing protein [Pseudomonadales bacterium]
MSSIANIITETLTPEVRDAVNAPIEQARTLPRQAFTLDAFAAAEREYVFSANWCALYFTELLKPGDLVPIEFAGVPLFMVRDFDDTLRVFHNITPYDGCLVVIDAAVGVTEIRTPYHGWRYGLDGHLIATPYWDGTEEGTDLGELGDRPHRLVEVASAVWGPILFVNVDGQAGEFEDSVGSLQKALGGWDLDSLSVARDEQGLPLLDPENLATNWKTHLENWGINVLHEAFVHDLYNQSPEVPRMNLEGKTTFEHYIDDRVMSLKYQESDFPQTYPELPFPSLVKDTSDSLDTGYFGSFLPNLHFGVFSGLIHFIVSLPEGATRTRTIRAQFYAQDAAAGSEFLELRLMLAAGLAEAGREDARITEAVQKARSSPAFDSQYYSKRWDTMHHKFSQWVLSQFPE